MYRFPWCFRCLLTGFALLALSGCKIEMHSNLDEVSANEMLAALLSNGISASKEAQKDGIALYVAEAQFSEAVGLLGSMGLPRDKFANTSEIFNAEGLVASPTQEWAKLNYAKSQELSHSIASIPGVVRVSVNIAEKRKDGPFDEAMPPSASVVAQVNERFMSDDLVPQIKQLVSFSVPAISYERVGVIVSPIKAQEVNQTLVSLAGILVHRDSVLAVRILGVIAAMSSICALTFGALVLLNWRSQRARGKETAVALGEAG